MLNGQADLAGVMIECIEGRLYRVDIKINKKSCAVVIIASAGYPDPFRQYMKLFTRPEVIQLVGKTHGHVDRYSQ